MASYKSGDVHAVGARIEFTRKNKERSDERVKTCMKRLEADKNDHLEAMLDDRENAEELEKKPRVLRGTRNRMSMKMTTTTRMMIEHQRRSERSHVIYAELIEITGCNLQGVNRMYERRLRSPCLEFVCRNNNNTVLRRGLDRTK
jgi:hypothetical protein